MLGERREAGPGSPAPSLQPRPLPVMIGLLFRTSLAYLLLPASVRWLFPAISAQLQRARSVAQAKLGKGGKEIIQKPSLVDGRLGGTSRFMGA